MDVDQIPVAFTPPGGWTGEMPPRVLVGCDTPLIDDAPDMRGTWRIIEVTAGGEVQTEHPLIGATQRIEQAGDRVTITAGGVVHDMRCDGIAEHGVNDVAEFDKQTPISVAATFEDGVHVLRPVGMPIEVRRRLDGEHLIWEYVGFTARLERVN